MSEEERQPCLNEAKDEITAIGSESNENKVENVKEINDSKAELLSEEVDLNDERSDELERNDLVISVSEVRLNENKDDRIVPSAYEVLINETKEHEIGAEEHLNQNKDNEIGSSVNDEDLNNNDDKKLSDNTDPSEVVTVHENLSEKEVYIKPTSSNNSESNDVGVESNVNLKEASGESSAEDAIDQKVGFLY